MVIFEDRKIKIKVTIDDDVLDALHQSALESYPNAKDALVFPSGD